jgi:geranylgeranyl diphosphate synthase type 3
MSRASPPLGRTEEHGSSSVQAQSQGQPLSPSQLQSQAEIAQYVGRDLIHGDGFSWSAEKENIVKGPYDYLEAHPGKDVRSQLINAFNLWLQVPEPSLAIINKVVGMLHTASLLIDDVEDNSNLRRGVPVAHHIFGTAQTINSANYVYFCALQEISKLNNPEAIRIYTDELLNLHRGQGMDLFWRDTLTCPSEDDYLEMVGNKTGGLFRLAIKLMHACSPSHNTPSSPTNNQTSYVPLVNTIGLLFQILDDYRNLSHPLYTANKGLCEDLTEGKFSFPIIHAIRANPANLVLINILKQKPVDDEVKKYAVGYMESVGSFAYTRRVLRGLTRKALLLVDEVDGGRGLGDGVRGILELLKVEKGTKEAKAEAVV